MTTKKTTTKKAASETAGVAEAKKNEAGPTDLEKLIARQAEVEKELAQLRAEREKHEQPVDEPAQRKAADLRAHWQAADTKWKKRTYTVTAPGLPALVLVACDESDAIRQAAECHGCGVNPSKHNFRATEQKTQSV